MIRFGWVGFEAAVVVCRMLLLMRAAVVAEGGCGSGGWND